MFVIKNIKPLLFTIIFLFVLLLIGWILISQKVSVAINTSRPAVVKQLQSLNRFETSTFTVEKIIDAGTNYNDIQQFLVGDKLLLIAHGQVIAGFDLSKLSANHVQVDKDTIILNLPKPQILVTKLDNELTRVYDRRQGILNHGDKDLESKARAAAERSITDAACQGRILDEAAKNGRNQLTTLLKSFGFNTVIINVPQSSC